MKTAARVTVLCVAVLAAMGCFASHDALADPAGAIEGSVEILDSSGAATGAENTIVYLETGGSKEGAPPPKRHTIAMQNKNFAPSHLIVRRGEKVVFENRDNFRHNVFSLSRPNEFDLGTYGPGERPGVELKSPGIAKVYCNIHPKMAAYILVSDSEHATTADHSGRFKLLGVPPGTYRISAWNLRGETRSEVTVQPGATQQVTLKITGAGPATDEHLNKFGKPYQPENLFDEAY